MSSLSEEHEFVVLESLSLAAASAVVAQSSLSSVVSLTDISINGDNQKASLADNTVRVMVFISCGGKLLQ